MNKSVMCLCATCLLAGTMLANGLAIGKLPLPTPEEQAAAEAMKAKEQEQLKKEKELLEQAQDRLAARYGKRGADGKGATGERTSDQNMPKTTSELPGGVGPTPRRPPSAEAHSGSAK